MTLKIADKRGANEISTVLRHSRLLFWFVALFSFFVNVLMLTSPLYMMQVYDRVLGSRSEATLAALTLIVVFLYVMMGFLDFTRSRLLARIGARFQAALDNRVFDAMLRRSVATRDPQAQTALKDLEAIQRQLASPSTGALFDLPWTPIFIAGLALFHPWLGLLAVAGGAALTAVALLNQLATRKPQARASNSAHRADLLSEEMRTEAEMIQSMGMRSTALARWRVARDAALGDGLLHGDRGGGFAALTKTLRMFLQSAMLGLGAYLALHGEITPGTMIAGSILMGRALAPIELLLSQWANVQRALKGRRNLAELLSKVQPEAPRTSLPRPKAFLQAQSLTVLPPGGGDPLLRQISFQVLPGQAIGVIGPSGSGKSTLARVLTGAWPLAAGTVRLDGATLEQYDPEVLGGYIGFLPQRNQLFEGTISQNIARLAVEPDSAKVVEAARKAAAHDMILGFADGYDTRVPTGGGVLSGGQIQRVALARALFGDPAVVILDEPNSNLDNEGAIALNQAIRQIKQENRSVLIMAHRPAALQECDMLLVLDRGVQVAFGPKKQVLEQVLAAPPQLHTAAQQDKEAAS
ncbi:type I secretion system permease/ATPase [Ruegeria pomeroyi]|uniref:type I secretion system permease/ATPase n=1 Tax=Ruegeria pomeroyi TaxID=89184 RepID=UPI001F3A6508|nr:type I secretion system permease/ATPase [Ruegeria pomeroyi]MCE8510974.1 type I secretion system permease/ATPase [Ruegeria pomeroyi]